MATYNPVVDFFTNTTQCINQGTYLNCQLTFFSNGTVFSIGNVTRAHFAPNSDVAGLGTMIAFFVPSGIALLIYFATLCSLIYEKENFMQEWMRQTRSFRGWRRKHTTKSDREYNMLDAALLAISDSQTILCLALFANFAFVSKCTMSWYHFNIGIYLTLIAIGNSLLSFSLVRAYFESKLSAAIRILITIGIMALLGCVFQVQTLMGITPQDVSPNGGSEGDNTHIMYLPVPCAFNDTYFVNITSSLSTEELDNVGGPFRPWWRSPAFIIYVCLTIMYGLTLFMHVFHGLRGEHDYSRTPTAEHQRFRSHNWSGFQLGFWWIVLAVCLANFIAGVVVTSVNRGFVASGTWMEKDPTGTNPESDVRTFGEWAALFAMIAIAITILEKYTSAPRHQRRAQAPGHKRR